MMEVLKAMPEFIQRNDRAPLPWNVEEGAPARGDAWTEMRTGRMRVPFGADELSRTVRAHELMHAKVSPHRMEEMRKLPLRHDCVLAAEEFRVNMLVANQGFDIDSLADGSESRAGKLLGQNNDWNGVVRFMATTAGTKAGSDFIRGLKSSNPDFAEQARALQKVLMKEWRKAIKRFNARGVASSTDEENGLPRGFNRFTVPVAKLLESVMIPEEADGVPSEHGNQEVPRVTEIAKGVAGKFALLIEKELLKTRIVDGKIGRKRIASNVGKNPRRINRMLTDPERRIFDRRARGKGGIVIIDQSGSMHLDEKDVWSIIEHAPGATIVGYSHRQGSKDIPNVWVIAERGKVADVVPTGNGGNGVDGPALRFSLSKRRMNEPVIWVCDGHVTDGDGDDFYPNLAEECAQLVVRNGIHMVPDVASAVSALKIASNGHRLETKAIGSIKNTEAWRASRL